MENNKSSEFVFLKITRGLYDSHFKALLDELEERKTTDAQQFYLPVEPEDNDNTLKTRIFINGCPVWEEDTVQRIRIRLFK